MNQSESESDQNDSPIWIEIHNTIQNLFLTFDSPRRIEMNRVGPSPVLTIRIFLNSQHTWMKGSHLKNYELFNKLCIRRKLTYFDGTLKIKKLSKNKSFGRFSLWILYSCIPRVEMQKVHLRPLKLLIMKFHLLSSDKVDLEVLKIRLKILWSHKF